MKRIQIFTLTLVLILLSLPTLTIADTITESTIEPEILTLLIDGKEINVNSISYNGQLFLAIDELAPELNKVFDSSILEKPTLNEVPKKFESTVTMVNIQISTRVVTNNSIGDEWEYLIKRNGVTYYPHLQYLEMTLEGKDLILELGALEYDSTKSDYGFETVTVPYTDILKREPLTYSKMITVTEESGRYAGNTATIEFNIVVTPM